MALYCRLVFGCNRLLQNIHTQLAVMSTVFLAISWVNPVLAQDNQDIPVIREYSEAEERSRFDALLAQFGQNKQLPSGYELQALLALSHYRELRDVKIRFLKRRIDLVRAELPGSRVILSPVHRARLVGFVGQVWGNPLHGAFLLRGCLSGVGFAAWG